MGPSLFADVERQAADIAWESGRMLLARFHQPLDIKWKGKRPGDDPVTDADHQVEAFIRAEIGRRFPGHAMVGEEGSGEGSEAAPYTWVVDPLDGTTNFLNGLPAFACSLALLDRGRPVVGVVFLPWPEPEGGIIVRAREGGGAWLNDRRLSLTGDVPLRGRLVVLPRGTFRLRGALRQGPGERRSVGSTAYELAATALGVYRYVLFSSPKSWDVAAGVLIVRESGGAVMTLRSGSRSWVPFVDFLADPPPTAGPGAATPPGQEHLRRWTRPILAGVPSAVAQASRGLVPHRPLLPRLAQRVRRALGRASPSRPSSRAKPAPTKGSRAS